jgi:quercetin dioxygenase-like cupin family protein
VYKIALEEDPMYARPAVLALLATSGAIAVALVHAQNLTPDQVKYQRNPATGSEISAIFGDPTKREPFVTRVKYPSGFKAMPHSHPIDIQVTVLEGTLYFAEGETFDEAKLKAYPAGSFIFEKANVPHYQMAKGPVTFQASGTGPNAFNFVNPQHDPRKKK